MILGVTVIAYQTIQPHAAKTPTAFVPAMETNGFATVLVNAFSEAKTEWNARLIVNACLIVAEVARYIGKAKCKLVRFHDAYPNVSVYRRDQRGIMTVYKRLTRTLSYWIANMCCVNTGCECPHEELKTPCDICLLGKKR